MALLLKRRGVQRVRPLAGGFAEWKRLGYPLSDPDLVQLVGK
jgi:3-mercaptopyruvate sulfurtransferase SseA